MTAIATFEKNPQKRVVTMKFIHPSLNAPDISKALSQFEAELHAIGEDSQYDFLVIQSDDGKEGGAGIHALFLEEMNVKEISRWEKIIVYIERMRKITIMALPEHVDDTLFQVALVCDYCLCMPKTTFKFSSIKSGYLPGMAVFRLTKFIGLGKAKQVLYKQLELSTRAALEAGIVEEVVPDLEKGVSDRIEAINPIEIEPTILARLIMTDSYHDSYEDEVGTYLAAQVRCFERLKQTEKQ